MDLIKTERLGDHAVVTLNRPDALNALSPALVAAWLAAMCEVARSDARTLVVRGAGRAFSAGADLKAVRDPAFTREDARAFSSDARALAELIETMPQPVIAEVHGYCFTGALEIILAADLIVAAEDAVFADTHAKIGRTPSWGLSQRLPRAVGPARARLLSFTARRISGLEAVAWGLVAEAVPSAQLRERVIAVADEIAANDARAVAGYKTLFRRAAVDGLDDGLRFEAEMRLPRVNPR